MLKKYYKYLPALNAVVSKVLAVKFCLLVVLGLSSVNALAITPTLSVIREISYGVTLPEPGSCRMIAKTGVIIDYLGTNICIMQDDAQNGLYTITANPNKNVRVKVPANLDDGNGLIFNPYIEMNSDGQTPQTIFNNTGYVIINSGTTGIVNLYLGGDLIVNRTYPYNHNVVFTFIDVIEWQEDP